MTPAYDRVDDLVNPARPFLQLQDVPRGFAAGLGAFPDIDNQRVNVEFIVSKNLLRSQSLLHARLGTIPHGLGCPPHLRTQCVRGLRRFGLRRARLGNLLDGNGDLLRRSLQLFSVGGKLLGSRSQFLGRLLRIG